jgi:hypothetical protein
MRDGKEVGFPKEHGRGKRTAISPAIHDPQEVVMWNWNSGILGPYLLNQTLKLAGAKRDANADFLPEP